MSKKLDAELIQKFRALGHVVIQSGRNLVPGQVVDRDENPIQFRAIVRANGRWSLPGTIHEDPRAELIVEERRTSSVLASEVWVSPDGSDDNDGTRGAPFAKISTALDTLVDRVGHDDFKVITVRGNFSATGNRIFDNVIINTRNLWIRVEQQNSAPARPIILRPKDLDRPVFFITNMTDESANDFLNEGGVSFTTTNDEYEYTGASVVGRDVLEDPDGGMVIGAFLQYKYKITITGFRFQGGDTATTQTPAICLVSGTPTADTPIFNSWVRIEDIQGALPSESSIPATIFLKNVDANYLGSLQLQRTQSLNSTVVLDNCFNNHLMEGSNSFSRRFVIFGNTVNTELNGSSGGTNLPIFFSADHGSLFASGNFMLEGPQVLMSNTDSNSNIALNQVPGDSNSRVNYNLGGNQAPEVPIPLLRTRNFNYSGGNLSIIRAELLNINHAGANLFISHLEAEGDVTVDTGALTANGGTIKGDLVVNTPATATLNNVVIEGNITGTGTVIQNGGGYLGGNTVTTYTHNALKTT